jgi:hypothetical protein
MFAKELTSGEQEMLGNFFTDIGNTLFTTSSLIDIKEAKEKTEKEKAESDKQTSNSEETLQKQIDDLEIQNQEMLKVIQELQKKIKQ